MSKNRDIKFRAYFQIEKGPHKISAIIPDVAISPTEMLCTDMGTFNEAIKHTGWSFGTDSEFTRLEPDNEEFIDGTEFNCYEDTDGDWVYFEGIVMQFTGHKDRNENEIYEGDILKFMDRVTSVVVFADFGGWCYKWIDPSYVKIRTQNPEPFFRNICINEVVGNIHQNPELLNSES